MKTNSKLFYKYRSMNALLDGFNELEDEYIYFSPARELNDPLEGYIDKCFKGDKIIWINFFKNYIFSFFIFRNIVYLTGNSKELTENDIHTDFNTELKEILSIDGQSYKMACDEILSNNCITFLMDYFSKRNTPVSKDELYSCLSSINFYILDVFTKIDVERGLQIQNQDELYKRLDNHSNEHNKLMLLLETIDKEGEKGIEALRLLLQYSNNNLDSLIYFRKLNETSDNIANKNYNLLIAFPKIYLNKLDEIMCIRPYITCFSESYENLSMWGYYADSSRGACLIFKPIKRYNTYYLPLEKVTSWGCGDKGYHETKSFVDSELKRVIYSKQKPLINFFRAMGRLNLPTLEKHWYKIDEQISETVKDLFDKEGKDNWRKQYWQNIEENANIKHKNWQHEQEYRISLIPIFEDEYDTIEKRKLKYKFDNLEGLIFGVNTNESDKLKIIEILFKKCKKYNRTDFKLYQAVYDNNNGKISTIPINILKYIKE